MTREIIIAGAGVGSLTLEVQEALKNADVIFAASRFVNLVPSGKKILSAFGRGGKNCNPRFRRHRNIQLTSSSAKEIHS